MWLEILIFVFLSLLAFGIYKCIYPVQYEYFIKLGGPPLTPIFGILFELLPHGALGISRLISRWHSLYNSPMRVKALNDWAVQIYKPEHMEVILKSRTNINKSPIYDFLRPWLGNGLLTSSNDIWHAQRKILTPTFHFQILTEFVSVFNRHSAELVEVIREKIRDSPIEAIDMQTPLTLATLDIICETSMGKQLNALKSQKQSPYITAILNFGEDIMYRIMRPWIRADFVFFNLTTIGRRQKNDIKIMHEFTERVISEREANYKENGDLKGKKRLAFLDLLLEFKRKGLMSLQEVREQVDTFMFEGHDTTATALLWSCYCLGRHPEIQKEVQEELDDILGPDVSTSPSTNQLAEMEYLERCIKETMRLYPSVPTVSRLLDETVEIEKDVFIPSGIMVELYIWSLHKNPEHFPDPEKFDPDRFLPENQEKRHPFAYTPFSAGPRNCIGQKFAMLEIKTTMCHLLRNFTLEAVQKPEQMDPTILLVLRPNNGVWIKFTERKI